MATNNEKKPPQDEPEVVEESQAKSKKKIPPIVIYVLIGVFMAGAGYFVGTKFLGSSKKAPAAAAESKKGKEEKKPAQKEKQKKSSEGPSSVYTISDLIVNPSGTGGTRFLSASIGFEISSPETAKLFEERQPLIRDALITILGSKTIDQLSDPKQKEITRYQIKKRVEQLLQVDDLAAVYFTDFILQ